MLLKRFSATVRRALGRPERATDGGAATASTLDATPSPGIPPDQRRCPNGCDARTELVSQHELLESEDDDEWLAGNDLYDRGIETAGRCRKCGKVHTNTAPRAT